MNYRSVDGWHLSDLQKCPSKQHKIKIYVYKIIMNAYRQKQIEKMNSRSRIVADAVRKKKKGGSQ